MAAPGAGCTPGYSPCIPPGPNVDCQGGGGDGPRYVQGPVLVTGSDPYDLDSDDSMQVTGKDRQGRGVKFTRTIYVDDTEYPTQMIFIDKKGERSVYIWKRKE